MFTTPDPEVIRAAQHLMEMQREIARTQDTKTTKEDLIQLGASIWPHSYRYAGDDDYEALQHIIARAGHKEAAPGVMLAAAMMVPNQQLLTLGSALWYHHGLHQIVLGHKFCAALLATKVNKDILEDVHAPWRAFYIVLPNKMFYAKSTDGRDLEVHGALVTRMQATTGELKWNYAALTDSSLVLWRHGYTTEMLLEGEEHANYDSKPFSEELEDLDRRTSAMIGRLIINVCLAMNDPTNVQKQPKDEWKGWDSVVGNKRKNKEPSVRTYILGKDNIPDCREAVCEYLRTGVQRKGLTVQVLVSGHFRSQPHGPQKSLRKTIWIEPFWRGPDDAPILAKPTVLK